MSPHCCLSSSSIEWVTAYWVTVVHKENIRKGFSRWIQRILDALAHGDMAVALSYTLRLVFWVKLSGCGNEMCSALIDFQWFLMSHIKKLSHSSLLHLSSAIGWVDTLRTLSRLSWSCVFQLETKSGKNICLFHYLGNNESLSPKWCQVAIAMRTLQGFMSHTVPSIVWLFLESVHLSKRILLSFFLHAAWVHGRSKTMVLRKALWHLHRPGHLSYLHHLLRPWHLRRERPPRLRLREQLRWLPASHRGGLQEHAVRHDVHRSLQLLTGKERKNDWNIEDQRSLRNPEER